MAAPVSPRDGRTLDTIRQTILGILALGTTGMSVELLLTGHFEDTNQLIPLFIAGASLLVMTWVAIRPGLVVLRAMQFMMLVFIGTSMLGITLHFRANAEFQREIDPSIGGFALFQKVLQATAPPALAPGLLAQLGLLGLVYTYRHPALRDEELGEGES